MKNDWITNLRYPTSITKQMYKSPIFLYRMGLGFMVGRLFMVMTTVGRKSGQPRRTAIEFHEFKGRKYIFSNWGANTDWYRNIQANPHITIQTWRGVESVLAHRITSDDELAMAFEFAASNPTMKLVLKSIGFDLTLEEFLTQKDRLVFITFDPVDQPTPPALKADLWWVWLLVLVLFFAFTVWSLIGGEISHGTPRNPISNRLPEHFWRDDLSGDPLQPGGFKSKATDGTKPWFQSPHCG